MADTLYARWIEGTQTKPCVVQRLGGLWVADPYPWEEDGQVGVEWAEFEDWREAYDWLVKQIA